MTSIELGEHQDADDNSSIECYGSKGNDAHHQEDWMKEESAMLAFVDADGPGIV